MGEIFVFLKNKIREKYLWLIHNKKGKHFLLINIKNNDFLTDT